MSYYSRLYNHRNAQSPDVIKDKPFFSRKQADNKTSQASFFQAKLSVNSPGDKLEHEADKVADDVVNKSSQIPVIHQTKISNIQKLAGPKEEEEGGLKGVQRIGGDPEKEKLKGLQKKDDPMQEQTKKNSLVQTKPGSSVSAISSQVSSQIESSAGKGNKLPAKTLHEMNSSFGADFNEVHVHDDSESAYLNKELNARAFTSGRDIYFNEGKYNPENTEGKHLLAHELTHVVQQQGSIQRDMIQCDFAPQSLPTSGGVFEFDMATREGLLAPPPIPAGAKSGVQGNIRFDPSTTAPYSNEIALIQIVKLTDAGTGKGVDSGSMTPGRKVKTTEDADSGVKEGFLTDVEHRRGGADATPGSPLSAQYMINQQGVRDRGEFGFKRSNDPADIKKAELFDFPGVTNTASNLDFEFETVAKGDDTMTIYGSLNWSFGIRAGDVVNEHVEAADAQSATFDKALELHRDFYVHEPVVFYFGFDQDALQPDEIAKIDTFLDYLTSFPDVRLSLTGYADRRGDPGYNADLSLRRAENVKRALIRKGIEEGKIDDLIIGMGATEEHTSGDRAPNPGQDQDLEANRRGNRRVMLTFEHTQSFPGP